MRPFETGNAPLIVNLAPTGMVPQRAHSPHVPLQPEDVVRDVLACAERGVTMVHLHARAADDRATFHKDVYARMIGGIRERRPDLIVCVSCSGRHGASLEQRAEVLTLEDDLRPDMGSLTLSSLNFRENASINDPATVTALATRMKENGIKPELEIFDLGMAHYAAHLAERGIIEPPYYANLLFGNVATAQATLLEAAALISALPPQTFFAMAGIGRTQLAVAAMAVATASGVRIGLEDNLWLDADRKHPATNADLVDRVHNLAEATGRPIMSAKALRQRLGLPMRG